MLVFPTKKLKKKVVGINNPRTKLGAVVATVALMFVPNCSAAMVAKVAQYPVPIPIKNAKILNF